MTINHRGFRYLVNAKFKDMRKIHGESGKTTKEYRAWRSIHRRCYSKTFQDYYNYGGRGITVCEHWRISFLNFLNDMGRSPSPMHTIERDDTNGPYSPENCRWATRSEQNQNKRNNILFTFDDRTQNLKQWCVELGISYGAARMRIKRGWTVQKAIFEKVRQW